MATGKTIVIGCKLPNGIVLFHPQDVDRAKGVEILGLNKSQVKGATYMTTVVDGDFWNDWKAFHKDFEPLKSNAIFEASGMREAEDKGKELAKEKTGFEPMPKEDDKIKAASKG